MSQKIHNVLLESTQANFVTIPNPATLYVEYKAKAGHWRVNDTQKIDPDTGKTSVREVSELNALLLAIRYRMEGETLSEFKILSPLIDRLTHPAPLYAFSGAGKNEGPIGDRDFVWSQDQDEIRQINHVKRAYAAVYLFCMVYYIQDGEAYGRLAQIPLSGYAFGQWIKQSKEVDLADNFNMQLTAQGSQIPNTHPKAKEGELLYLPNFDFSTPAGPAANLYLSEKASTDIATLVEYLNARTYSANPSPEETTDGPATTAQAQEPDLSGVSSSLESDDDLPF